MSEQPFVAPHIVESLLRHNEDAIDAAQNLEREPCVRCGQKALGYARGVRGRLCHPNNPTKPDCYTMDAHDISMGRIDA